MTRRAWLTGVGISLLSLAACKKKAILSSLKTSLTDSRQMVSVTQQVTAQDVSNTCMLVSMLWPVVFNNNYCVNSSFSVPRITTCINGGLVNVTQQGYQQVIKLGDLKAGETVQVWGLGIPMQTPLEPKNFNVISN